MVPFRVEDRGGFQPLLGHENQGSDYLGTIVTGPALDCNL